MVQTLPNTVPYPQQRKHIESYLAKLGAAEPQTMQAFAGLKDSAMNTGALDSKTKELIALAIAVAARCDGCISFYTQDALNAGATAAEITDTLSVAVLMGGGPSMVYATHVLEAMEQFNQENNG